MASKENKTEKCITLPKHLVDKCNGFSLDFGGSVIKACYIPKDCSAQANDQDEGTLRLVSFAREELPSCLDFLRENSLIRRGKQGERPVIYSTGIGGFQFGKLIDDTLQVSLENTSESDAFVVAMEYLKENKPLEEYCEPFYQEGSDRARRDAVAMAEALGPMKESGAMRGALNPGVMRELTETYPRELPPTETYILGSFGSAWGGMKVGCYDKHDYSFSNFTTFAGRSFVGLGCLLTGAKNYEELVDLAEMGDNVKLDQTDADVSEVTSDTKESSTGTDLYSGWEGQPSTRPLFSWGKAVGKNLGDFKKEDVARSLLQTCCHHAAITAYDSLVMEGARHIFMAGGFCDHPLVQNLVLEEFENRKFTMASFLHGRDSNYHVHILKHGAYLGALGALIKGAGLSHS